MLGTVLIVLYLRRAFEILVIIVVWVFIAEPSQEPQPNLPALVRVEAVRIDGAKRNVVDKDFDCTIRECLGADLIAIYNRCWWGEGSYQDPLMDAHTPGFYFDIAGTSVETDQDGTFAPIVGFLYFEQDAMLFAFGIDADQGDTGFLIGAIDVRLPIDRCTCADAACRKSLGSWIRSM